MPQEDHPVVRLLLFPNGLAVILAVVLVFLDVFLKCSHLVRGDGEWDGEDSPLDTFSAGGIREGAFVAVEGAEVIAA